MRTKSRDSHITGLFWSEYFTNLNSFGDILHPPKNQHDTRTFQPWMKMYLLLKDGDFPSTHVSFQGQPLVIFLVIHQEISTSPLIRRGGCVKRYTGSTFIWSVLGVSDNFPWQVMHRASDFQLDDWSLVASWNAPQPGGVVGGSTSLKTNSSPLKMAISGFQ